ncbi:copper homeostasis protein CutC [Youngiibacter fragilis]|uniref:Copper homeostasis protein cutC homolog n=1 Tax=Youngiibacter fragilis 232.1 TaxID=994573 RepID=V7I232_9CLOT|nr:copper homeostasis protein CutC [Youngiibacter fragilis]ETA79341.1 copper homeostasis protein [Youngiibacter fragilis 232.1]
MIEMIAASIEDALTIERAGADRIDLRTAFSEGGLTPSYGLIEQVVRNVSIPVHVIIKPHSRGYVYSQRDLDVMKGDAWMISELGCSGASIGILDQEGMPDIEAIDYVLGNTNLKFTFNRAIDRSTDLMESLEVLKRYDRCQEILTSGGPGSAFENFRTLKEISDRKGRLGLFIGSGVEYHNIQFLTKSLKGCHLHMGTAIRKGERLNPVDLDDARELVEKYRLALLGQ